MMNFRLFDATNNYNSKHNLPKDYVDTLFCQRTKDLPLYVINDLLI